MYFVKRLLTWPSNRQLDAGLVFCYRYWTIREGWHLALSLSCLLQSLQMPNRWAAFATETYLHQVTAWKMI